MKLKKTLATITAIALTGTLTVACTQAERASYNVSIDADNFRVDRRLAVLNVVTGEPQLELTGKFSIEDADNQLEVTVRTDDNTFKKHIVGLGPGVTYVVEDIHGADVSSTRYQISYLPEAIIPVEFHDGTQD